jgi:radical SAM superfamily enzyme YgiQ (UPF0313 family)
MSVRLSQGLKDYRFDLSGRPLSLTIKGQLFKRGLDGTMLRIRRYEEGAERFHYTARVGGQDREELLSEVRSELLGLKPLLGENFRRLSPVLDIDLAEDAQRFSRLYGRIGILPPESYRSLLLNLTRGCSYNKCSFCDFFKAESYKVRSAAEFRDHIGAAKAAFGDSIKSRRGIFLGQANAGNVPQDALTYALSAVRDAFPCEFTDQKGQPRHPLQFEQVSCFLDTFSQSKRTLLEWCQLRDLGLSTLYLGVESGSPKVLKLLRKPGHPRLLIPLVQKLKQARIGVNVIIMTGVGGKEMASEHIEQTARLLNALGLTGSDRIQFSAFLPTPNSEYSLQDEAKELTPLTRFECRMQKKQICSHLNYEESPTGPTRSLYDVSQFIY